MSDNITIFLCENSPEGILTAVYEAWASKKGHSHVKLKLNQMDTLELFADYVVVEPDVEKAEKVRRSIRQKISTYAWEMVYRAALSEREEKADDIYRFLVGGFYYGARVVNMLAEPVVMRMVEMNRSVGNEAHLTREFLRFDEREGGILFARIRTKNDVLTLVAPHFADRLSGENFLILDVGRRRAAIHPANQSWYLTALTPEQADSLLSTKPDEYRDLWKTFFRAIAIEERKNPKLQRSMMPLHYREFALEFDNDLES